MKLTKQELRVAVYALTEAKSRREQALSLYNACAYDAVDLERDIANLVSARDKLLRKMK